MKPIIILLEGAMSDEDIKAIRDNDVCVVIAKDPALVRFVDPILRPTANFEQRLAELERLVKRNPQ